jgi:hypothetical protein
MPTTSLSPIDAACSIKEISEGVSTSKEPERYTVDPPASASWGLACMMRWYRLAVMEWGATSGLGLSRSSTSKRGLPTMAFLAAATARAERFSIASLGEMDVMRSLVVVESRLQLDTHEQLEMSWTCSAGVKRDSVCAVDGMSTSANPGRRERGVESV